MWKTEPTLNPSSCDGHCWRRKWLLHIDIHMHILSLWEWWEQKKPSLTTCIRTVLLNKMWLKVLGVRLSLLRMCGIFWVCTELTDVQLTARVISGRGIWMRPPEPRSECTIEAGLRPPTGAITATSERGGREKIWSLTHLDHTCDGWGWPRLATGGQRCRRRHGCDGERCRRPSRPPLPPSWPPPRPW
jgi:hypothetical protein